MWLWYCIHRHLQQHSSYSTRQLYSSTHLILSPKKFTQQQLNILSIELQLQLGHDKILSHFLPDRLFPAYESEEINQHKIAFLSSVNPDRPRPRYLNCDSKVTIDQRTALLTRLHRHYQVFLYQVGKFLSDRVVYNSTGTYNFITIYH